MYNYKNGEIYIYSIMKMRTQLNSIKIKHPEREEIDFSKHFGIILFIHFLGLYSMMWNC